MVTTRKPKAPTRAKRSTPRKRETLEEKFQRVLAEPVDAPFPKLTKREARYFLRRLAETGDPNSPSGVEVMKEFYGDWSEDEPQN
jgi:hypothetical protein